MAVSKLARQHGFSTASFYACRAKYGDMEAEDAKRLKELESENNRLKQLLAEAHPDIEALKVGFEANHQVCLRTRFQLTCLPQKWGPEEPHENNFQLLASFNRPY